MVPATTCTKCDAPAAKANLCLDHLREAVAQWKAANGRCSVDGCTTPARARGMCKAHYQQDLRTRDDRDPCSVEDCDAPATSKGMCDKHRMRVIRTGTPDTTVPEAVPCSADGCDDDAAVKGMCRKHYHRDYRRRRRAAA